MLFRSIFGAHRSIVAAKREALAALLPRIRPAARDLLAGKDPGGDARLADALAYHAFVERVREWPVGAPALVRALLIAALGVGSWLGGAVVDLILQRALG